MNSIAVANRFNPIQSEKLSQFNKIARKNLRLNVKLKLKLKLTWDIFCKMFIHNLTVDRFEFIREKWYGVDKDPVEKIAHLFFYDLC